MSDVDITAIGADELGELAALAETCQRDPERYCAYTGDDATSIAADVADVAGWPTRLAVARRGAAVAGWILAEVDEEMGRVWWWGPFVGADDARGATADALYVHARAHVVDSTGIHQLGEELAADERSRLFAELAARHGFAAAEGSACLVLGPPAAAPAASPPDGVDVEPLRDDHHHAIASLHDALFPGTHTTGTALVAPAHGRLRRAVASIDGAPVGYVATELQHDGSLYIDFVGVAPAHTGRGIGRALVMHACHDGFARGATHAHLTVRASNAAARALYRSLGFVEERVLVPYRAGFSLD